MSSIQGPSVIFYVEMMGGNLRQCEFMYISFLFVQTHTKYILTLGNRWIALFRL